MYNGNGGPYDYDPPPPPQNSRVKVEDALTYLDQVKTQFTEEPQVYTQFLDIMKDFKSQAIDTPGVIMRVSALFAGKPHLITGFNQFLPSGFEVIVDSGRILISEPSGVKKLIEDGQVVTIPAQFTGYVELATQQDVQYDEEEEEDEGVDEEQEAEEESEGELVDDEQGEEEVMETDSEIQEVLSSAEESGEELTTEEELDTDMEEIRELENGDLDEPDGSEHGAVAAVEQSIRFVNKIKARFENRQIVYQQFLNILQTFQYNVTEQEDFDYDIAEKAVLDAVTVLFSGEDDLLEEFRLFLPTMCGITEEQKEEEEDLSDEDIDEIQEIFEEEAGPSGEPGEETGKEGSSSSEESGEEDESVDDEEEKEPIRPETPESDSSLSSVDSMLEDEEIREQIDLEDEEMDDIEKIEGDADSSEEDDDEESSDGDESNESGEEGSSDEEESEEEVEKAEKVVDQSEIASKIPQEGEKETLEEKKVVEEAEKIAEQGKKLETPEEGQTLPQEDDKIEKIAPEGDREELMDQEKQPGRPEIEFVSESITIRDDNGLLREIKQGDRMEVVEESSDEETSSEEEDSDEEESESEEDEEESDEEESEEDEKTEGEEDDEEEVEGRKVAELTEYHIPDRHRLFRRHSMLRKTAEAFRVARCEDFSFFEKIRRTCTDNDYDTFIRALALYNGGVVSAQELVNILLPIIGGLSGFLNEFNHRYLSKDRLHIPSAMEALTEEQKFNIDYASCKQLGISYRSLPEASQTAKCSGRTRLCDTVLNDVWVSFPSWSSEDTTVVSSKKTAYEEFVCKTEDERFELDIIIEVNKYAIDTLEMVKKKITRMSTLEQEKFRLDEKLGGSSATLMGRAIRRIYGEHAAKIIDALKRNPLVTVPKVIERMREKERDWFDAQEQMNKVWREQNDRFMSKALDHQSNQLKTSDAKWIKAKQLIHQIEVLFDERQTKYVEGTSDDEGPHMILRYPEDKNILDDVQDLIMHHVNRQTTISTMEKDRIRFVLRYYVPEWFFLPPPPDLPITSDEEEDDEEEIEKEKKELLDESEKEDEGEEKNEVKKRKSKEEKRHEPMEVNHVKAEENEYPERNQEQNDEEMENDKESEEDELPRQDEREVIEDVKGSARTRLIYGGNHLLVFLRVHHILCERLTRIKKCWQEMVETQKMDEQIQEVRKKLYNETGKNKNLAHEMVISDMNNGLPELRSHGVQKDVTTYYNDLLTECRNFLEGTIESQAFEDITRNYFPLDAHLLFSIDKMAALLTRQLLPIATNADAADCLRMYDRYKVNPPFSSNDESDYRAGIEQEYANDAETKMNCQNCFRVVLLDEAQCQVAIELIDTETEEMSFDGDREIIERAEGEVISSDSEEEDIDDDEERDADDEVVNEDDDECGEDGDDEADDDGYGVKNENDEERMELQAEDDQLTEVGVQDEEDEGIEGEEVDDEEIDEEDKEVDDDEEVENEEEEITDEEEDEEEDEDEEEGPEVEHDEASGEEGEDNPEATVANVLEDEEDDESGESDEEESDDSDEDSNNEDNDVEMETEGSSNHISEASSSEDGSSDEGEASTMEVEPSISVQHGLSEGQIKKEIPDNPSGEKEEGVEVKQEPHTSDVDGGTSESSCDSSGSSSSGTSDSESDSDSSDEGSSGSEETGAEIGNKAKANSESGEDDNGVSAMDSGEEGNENESDNEENELGSGSSDSDDDEEEEEEEPQRPLIFLQRNIRKRSLQGIDTILPDLITIAGTRSIRPDSSRLCATYSEGFINTDRPVGEQLKDDLERVNSRRKRKVTEKLKLAEQAETWLDEGCIKRTCEHPYYPTLQYNYYRIDESF